MIFLFELPLQSFQRARSNTNTHARTHTHTQHKKIKCSDSLNWNPYVARVKAGRYPAARLARGGGHRSSPDSGVGSF